MMFRFCWKSKRVFVTQTSTRVICTSLFTVGRVRRASSYCSRKK